LPFEAPEATRLVNLASSDERDSPSVSSLTPANNESYGLPVDKIEAAKFLEFKKVKQLSIGGAHLQGNERVENGALCQTLETALGAGALPLGVSLDSTT
jgi:hypothetical protein